MAETVSFGGRSRWWPRLVVVAVLLVLVALWSVSERQSDREKTALADCARAAEGAVGRAERRLAALASYIAPSVDSSTYRTFEGLHDVLSRDAGQHLPVVQRAHAVCGELSVWWLHTGVRREQDAYVALLTAELERLNRITLDGTEFYEGYDEIMRLIEKTQRE